MLLRSCLAVPAVLLMLTTAHAATEECPAKSTQMDDIIAELQKAPSCNRAMKIFEACEYGASGDVQFGAVVEKRCEGDFLSGLGTSQKKAYAGQLKRCDHKYDNESGTMYRSFTAFCRAIVAQRYSQKALKAGPKSRSPRQDQAASAALAFSAIAWNATGSWIARSDSTLRSTTTPDLERPLINTL